jgi:hypothetical protein
MILVQVIKRDSVGNWQSIHQGIPCKTSRAVEKIVISFAATCPDSALVSYLVFLHHTNPNKSYDTVKNIKFQ